MMQLQPINTSQKLRAAGYDGATKVLTVELRDGTRWQYPDVDPQQWANLAGGLDGDVTFDSIERAGRNTRTLVTPEASPLAALPVGARVREMQLTGDYGAPGTPTRGQYEALQQRLCDVQTAPVEAQLAETDAQRAHVSLASDPDEIRRLTGRRDALLLMLATAEPAIAQINAELDAVRETYQRGQALAAQRKLQDQRQTGTAHLRLAELNKLIAAPGAITPEEMTRSYSQCNGDLRQATQLRMENLKRERSQLRALLGLPDDDDKPVTDAADVRAAWQRKVREQAAEQATGAAVVDAAAACATPDNAT